MSLFAKAQKIEQKSTGRAKAEKQEIALAGIQSLAEVKAMMASLEAVSKTLESSIKETGFGEFLAMETKVRPDSFKGTDGFATCSVEMRKRGTNSALNDDEVAALAEVGITPHKEVITTEMYGINPIFAADDKLMERVSKALEKIVPEGFIVLQEERSKLVVSDPVLEAAFALEHGSEERKTALSICTTMALKPKLNEDYDMSKLAENVNRLVSVSEDTVAELEAVGVKLVETAAEAKPVRKSRKVAA